MESWAEMITVDDSVEEKTTLFYNTVTEINHHYT